MSQEELARALAFMQHVDDDVAEELRPWSCGVGLITPQLPKVWDASYFRLDDPRAAEAREILAETTEIASDAGLAHVAIVVSDEDAAASLGPELRRLGFEATRFTVMALRRVPPPPEAAIEEVTFDDVAASRRATTLEFFPGQEDLADQLRQLDRRLEATIGGRWFAVREEGEIASRAWLLGRGGVGQVEDVATATAARGRGLARSVVSAAARASHASGNDLTFVIADADETTPELYLKTGFEPIGMKHRYVRRLSATA